MVWNFTGLRAELLAAIRRDPKDETLRLVFADHLDEDGDAKWAEFVRLQVQMEHTRKAGKVFLALKKRTSDLFPHVADRTAPPRSVTKGSLVEYGVAADHPGLVGIRYRRGTMSYRVVYRRGLPCLINCSKQDFVDLAKYAFEWPVVRVTLSDAAPLELLSNAQWSWWLCTTFGGRGRDDLPRPLFRAMCARFPENAHDVNSVKPEWCEFPSERAAHRALEKTALAYGRAEYEKRVTKELRRRIKA